MKKFNMIMILAVLVAMLLLTGCKVPIKDTHISIKNKSLGEYNVEASVKVPVDRKPHVAIVKDISDMRTGENKENNPAPVVEVQDQTETVVEQPDAQTPPPLEPEPTQTVKDCKDEDCFKTAYEACAPATYTAETLGAFGVSYQYEILGPKDNGCEIKSEFLKNPNPDFEGIDMTCVYDNSKPLETAIVEVNDDVCEGELYDKMYNPSR